MQYGLGQNLKNYYGDKRKDLLFTIRKIYALIECYILETFVNRLSYNGSADSYVSCQDNTQVD